MHILIKQWNGTGWEEAVWLNFDPDDTAYLTHATHEIEMRSGMNTEERVKPGELFYIEWGFDSSEEAESFFDRLVQLNKISTD